MRALERLAWLLWQYFDTHKAAICMAAQKGRLSSIFNKQQISACKEGEGWRGEGWRGKGRGRGGEGRGGEGRGGEGRGGVERGGEGRGGEGWRGEGRGGEGWKGEGREGRGREGRGGEGRGGEGRGGEGRGGEGRTKERNEESMAGEYGLPCKHVLMFACLPAPVQADLTCWTVRLSIDSLWRLVLGGFVLRVLHSTSRLHPLLPAPWARGETSKGRRGQEEVPEQRPAVLCPHTAYRQ